MLDTGINNGHPLIAPALADTDLHSVEPGWGVEDGHGHGTQMAGLALAGDLTSELASADQIEVRHRLEQTLVILDITVI